MRRKQILTERDKYTALKAGFIAALNGGFSSGFGYGRGPVALALVIPPAQALAMAVELVLVLPSAQALALALDFAVTWTLALVLDVALAF